MSQYPLCSSVTTNESTSDIFNGARCKSYSWSQSHCDLEIRVKLTKTIKQDQINVALSKRKICVNLTDGYEKKTLIKGKFEHQIDVDSAYWVLDKEGPHLVIFMDKIEDMWWKKLLEDETASEQGPKNFTVPMDQLDEGSRMVIDKLVTSQKKKLTRGNDIDSLSPA